MINENQPKAKRGRRPRHADGQLPTALSFRVRAETHKKLRTAAEVAKTSISEEIERRIENQLRRENDLTADDANLAILLEIVLAAAHRLLREANVPSVGDPGFDARAQLARNAIRRGAFSAYASYVLDHREGMGLPPELTESERNLADACIDAGQKKAQEVLPVAKNEVGLLKAVAEAFKNSRGA
jgi:hypothetical protein